MRKTTDAIKKRARSFWLSWVLSRRILPRVCSQKQLVQLKEYQQ
jgi:hypothetical protein